MVVVVVVEPGSGGPAGRGSKSKALEPLRGGAGRTGLVMTGVRLSQGLLLRRKV